MRVKYETHTKAPRLTQRTWLGQRGESGQTVQGFGPRVVVHRWLEDGEQGEAGEVIVRAIKGDGRTDDFREYHKDVLPPTATDEDLDWAMDRAACALISADS